MITKTCSYRVVSNGEISNLTTSCVFEKRGGISKITFSNGANSYTFLVGKNAVTISTLGESQYSFILSKGLGQAFNLVTCGATFKAQVSCSSLDIQFNNENLKVSASYKINLSGNITPIDFSLTVK